MTSSNTKNFFATNLSQLQNFIKRDSTSYKDEFLQTYQNYESTLQVYLMKPSKPNRQLADLAMFLAHVSQRFPEELKSFPQQLIDILKKYSTVLHKEMRLTFCKCLMLIRGKNLIEPIPIFQSFFGLFKCPDKTMRSTLYIHLLNDVKKIKTKLKNHKLCSQVQQFVFTLTKDSNQLVVKYALNLLIDLYKKQIWNDAKTVNVIASCCFIPKMTKVLALALQFFAGKDADKDSDNESDSEAEDKATVKQVMMQLRVGKKTKSRQKRTDRAMKAITKEKKTKKRKATNGVPHFSALNLIYDPQDFAEKLFKLVETTNEGFEIKLSILDLIARLIGIHSLYLNNFHSFLTRFLNPHQRDVTKILWFTAVSSHELTPPDIVESVLMAIANNFITERNNSEVIAVGLNSIREICARCPLAMNEDLLGDLVQYNTYKDKAVSTAAKSLIQLFRDTNPQMLQRKMRGKPTEASYADSLKVKQYGEIDALSYVPGAEIISIEQSKLNDLSSDNNDKKRKREDDDDDDEDEDEDDEWEETTDSEAESEENDGVKEPSSKKRKKHSEDEEDDDEEEWIDVSSEDGEGGGEKSETERTEDNLMTLKEKEEKAAQISTDKILTQEDFKRIRIEQLKKKVTDKNFTKGSKKTITIETDDDEEESKAKRDNLLPISSITHINKKQKENKEARMQRIKEGREDRGKFGQRFKSDNLGKTNKEKRKTKSFMMIKHKANKKQKRSYKDKTIALRKSLLKQKKMN